MRGEDWQIEDFKDCSLYINTMGYAFLEYWPSMKRKYYLPNKHGYIFIKHRKINFKRLLFKTLYPKLDLSNKIIICVMPQLFSSQNLFALTKNQYRTAKNLGLTFSKNEVTGETIIDYQKKS